ncbi:MAG TPA: GIY-YIG nuclease family protein [Candidatus Acidoferrales bacterium]
MTKSKKRGIITGYARGWPREIFDIKKGSKLLAKQLPFLQQPGVYILYRDEHPYYIGKADRLYRRIGSHATKPQAKYYNFWNRFSAFAVVKKEGIDEVEAILIAAIPTVNSAKPKLAKEKLPKDVANLMREMRRDSVKDVKARLEKLGARAKGEK